MFDDLELLFVPASAPGPGPIGPVFTPAPPQEQAEPAADPEPAEAGVVERPFALPSPETLARLIEQHYSAEERYALICELVRPEPGERAQAEAEPEPEEEEEGLPAPQPRGPRTLELHEDGFACLGLNQTRELQPAEGYPQRLKNQEQLAEYLGVGLPTLSGSLVQLRKKFPRSAGLRVINGTHSRAAQQIAGQAYWFILPLPSAAPNPRAHHENNRPADVG